MTPLQFAKAECSNYNHESGSCRGIGIRDDGSQYSFGTKPQCVIALNQRCPFFEQCVIPMVEKMDSQGARGIHPSGRRFDTVALVAKIKIESMKAVRTYRKTHKLHCADERPCPTCGRAMEPKQQFCELCSIQRRKEQNRRAKSQSRSHVSNQAPGDP